MTRQRIRTDRAPAAIGPYSQAIVASGLVFVAGQIPIDPATGALVAGGIEAQTERVMRNIAAILEEAGSSMEGVVKTTVYLADLSEFEAMNRVYGRFFEGGEPPARATVQVSRLPKGASVEIDAVALKA
jgi:2-iminobutanoate/2-iminopropanoate deaminase